MSWSAEVAEMKAAGFSETEIADDVARQRGEMMGAGFSGEEIDAHFGIKNPDMTTTRDLLEGNLQKWRISQGLGQDVQGPPQAEGIPGALPVTPPAPKVGPDAPKTASTFLESVEAGFDMSVLGLGLYGAPNVVMPEHAGRYYRIASQVSTLAGDMPAMIAGAFAGASVGGIGGAAAGGAVANIPGVIAGGALGASVGAGAGAFALPAALRTAMMEHYEKGDIQSFGDFWDRASAVFIETGKGAVIGGLTAGVGGAVGKALGPVATPMVKTSGVLASEVATMVTVGAALEGHAPNPDDFIDAAILVGGLHASTKMAGKLRTIYARTGVRPEQVLEHTKNDPVVLQELLAEGEGLPKAYEGAPVPGVEAKTSEPITVKSAGPELSPAEKAVSDRIVDHPANTKDPLSWDKLYTATVDRLNPIKVMRDELLKSGELATSKDPYKVSRMFSDAGSKVGHFFKFGTMEFKTLETKGKSLDAVLEPVKADRAGFENYAVAAKAIEYEARGIKTGVSIAESKVLVASGGKKYGKVLKELTQFQNESLAYLKDSGYLSKESYKAITKSSEIHIPFRRLMDEGSKSGGVGKNPVKGIKGSEREILSPLQSIVKNVEAYVKLSEKNRALVAAVEMIEGAKEAGAVFGERVPNKVRGIKVSETELQNHLAEHGIEGAPEGFTVYRQENRPLGKNEIEVYREGRQEIWKVTPELAEAFATMEGNPGAQNLLTRFLRPFASSLRFTLALTPDFITRNLIRDQVTATAFSKYKSLPFIDSIKSLGHIWKQDEVYQSWLKSGGGMSSFTEISRSYLEQGDIFKLSKETGFIDSAQNVIKTPVEFMQATAKMIEDSTRLAEYKRVSAKEGIFEGGFASREVTVDFARMGAQVQALNSVSAFFNIQIQGMDRTVRAFKDNPSGTTARVAAAITLPSVLLWYANKDDKRYRELPRWQKDLFWIVMTKDTIYRIPKPQEVGLLFGSLPERMLDRFFTDNPNSFKDFQKTMTEAFTPSFMPNAVSPVLEQLSNRSFFTGGKIIPAQLEKIAPAYQYTEYTTESGKLLAKMAGYLPGTSNPGSLASPMVVENYVRAWTGSLGMYALQLADKALQITGTVPDPIRPASTLADIPFIKAFVIRYPGSTAQSIQDFYDSYSENEVVFNTIRMLAKSGNVADFELESNRPENREKALRLTSIKEALTAQSQYVRMVYKNPQMTADEKRQQIDFVYNMMIQEARQGNEDMDSFKKSLREQEKQRNGE